MHPSLIELLSLNHFVVLIFHELCSYMYLQHSELAVVEELQAHGPGLQEAKRRLVVTVGSGFAGQGRGQLEAVLTEVVNQVLRERATRPTQVKAIDDKMAKAGI